jgi:hypothetical protein
VIRSATVGGTALVPSDLVDDTDRVRLQPERWTEGWQNVVIGYEHGLDYPPARAKDVALALAPALSGSPADDRATSMSTEQETTTFYVPGASEPFDVPAANRFVAAANTLRTGIA